MSLSSSAPAWVLCDCCRFERGLEKRTEFAPLLTLDLRADGIGIEADGADVDKSAVASFLSSGGEPDINSATLFIAFPIIELERRRRWSGEVPKLLVLVDDSEFSRVSLTGLVLGFGDAVITLVSDSLAASWSSAGTARVIRGFWLRPGEISSFTIPSSEAEEANTSGRDFVEFL